MTARIATRDIGGLIESQAQYWLRGDNKNVVRLISTQAFIGVNTPETRRRIRALENSLLRRARQSSFDYTKELAAHADRVAKL